MRRPCVFVSSTCYDLKQVRVDIGDFLEVLGLEPILSEFNTFPVDPDVGTLDNCLKVVEAKADLFILIIGARYGSDTDQGKSITNLEFLTAHAKGIPSYVFVSRPILDILPVWRQNRDADFSKVADSPKLFEFVAQLRDDGGNWVFPFDSAQEIFEVLRTQLAYLFQDALELRLRAKGSGALSQRLSHVRGPALRLIIQRPRAWEYLLFACVLGDALHSLADRKRDWQYAVAMGPVTLMTPRQLFQWFQEKLEEAGRMAHSLETIINKALTVSFGPPGVSGDPEGILYAAKRVAEVYENLLKWKLDFLQVEVPDELRDLQSMASSFCDNFVADIERFRERLDNALSEGLAASAGGQRVEINLTLTLTAPETGAYRSEIRRLQSLFESGALGWS